MKSFVIALIAVYSIAMNNSEVWAQLTDSSQVNQSSLLQPPPYLRVSPHSTRPPYPIGYVDQMPVYPGGNEAILRFIAENTVYPAAATQAGRVYVSFWVTGEGKIDSTKITKGLEPVLDAEALRVINSLGRFVPGAQNGRPVAIPYTVPVDFPPAPMEPSKHRRKRKG